MRSGRKKLMTDRLTKRQAQIVGAFTGIVAGPFPELHEYIQEILGRPVFTIELGNEEMADRISAAAKEDFLNLVRTVDDDG